MKENLAKFIAYLSCEMAVAHPKLPLHLGTYEQKWQSDLNNKCLMKIMPDKTCF